MPKNGYNGATRAENITHVAYARIAVRFSNSLIWKQATKCKPYTAESILITAQKRLRPLEKPMCFLAKTPVFRPTRFYMVS